PYLMLPGCQGVCHRHPVASYYGMTCFISWTGALLVAAPALVRHEPVSRTMGVLMFPAMLLGPPLSAILLTGVLEGRAGLLDLTSSLSLRRVTGKGTTMLLIPPALILTVLMTMRWLVAPVFAPNIFLPGFLFGIPAGLLEEVGWTGFAYPRLFAGRSQLAASVELGLLWSCWHLPVINYLGAVTPHGRWWPAYFLAFALAMTAMRVLISWLYANTRSLTLAQWMHISSTGSLVVLSPPHVSAAQEALWYALYGVLLWLAALTVGHCFGGPQKQGPQ
ncbi:MAG: CPBP family intramembrane glutamic endopeptidase, partial [Terracidiphilus sp.]